MVQNSVSFTICVQSYLIHMQSYFLYSVSHLIYIQSTYIYIQSHLIYVQSQPIYIQSHLIYIQSHLIYIQSTYIYSVYVQSQLTCIRSDLIYIQSNYIYLQSHVIYIQFKFIIFCKHVQCVVRYVENLIKICSFLKKNECMSYRIIFYKEIIVIRNGKIVWKHGPYCSNFRLNLKYLGWLYKEYTKTVKNGGFCLVKMTLRLF